VNTKKEKHIQTLESLIERDRAAVWSWEKEAIQAGIEALKKELQDEGQTVVRYSEGNVSTTYAEPEAKPPSKEIGHILIKRHKVEGKGCGMEEIFIDFELGEGDCISDREPMDIKKSVQYVHCRIIRND